MRRNTGLALVMVTTFVGANVAAQSKGTRGGWTPPRTPDGQPDLQGIWTNPTITSFERPASLGDKAFLTERETEASSGRRRAPRGRRSAASRRRRQLQPVLVDSGDRVVSTRRTSLVIDPPDGRVPLRPEAEAARDYDRAHERDSYEFMSVWDRCITRGVPGGMFPAG